MSSDDEQVPLNIPMMLTQHFQHLISEDVEELAMQLFELDALDEADSQEGSSSRQEGKQKYLNRGRKDGDARLWNDYFAPEPTGFNMRHRIASQFLEEWQQLYNFHLAEKIQPEEESGLQRRAVHNVN
ncbi:hypothetical protein E3N88_24756 [Mikania micrantha]|uniref:Uncharacterized protein n=1 Tax=Mikania micrantha TaxID=192012 RepID=A0A5N6N5Q6_9ASTR|nr:hypothetical protein E3N88_24756 [Mikania micrantha]